jgi:hypothetical protein
VAFWYDCSKHPYIKELIAGWCLGSSCPNCLPLYTFRCLGVLLFVLYIVFRIFSCNYEISIGKMDCSFSWSHLELDMIYETFYRLLSVEFPSILWSCHLLLLFYLQAFINVINLLSYHQHYCSQ